MNSGCSQHQLHEDIPTDFRPREKNVVLPSVVMKKKKTKTKTKQNKKKTQQQSGQESKASNFGHVLHLWKCPILVRFGTFWENLEDAPKFWICWCFLKDTVKRKT